MNYISVCMRVLVHHRQASVVATLLDSTTLQLPCFDASMNQPWCLVMQLLLREELC